MAEPHQTAVSKKLVEQFVELKMMGGDRTQITRFFDGRTDPAQWLWQCLNLIPGRAGEAEEAITH